MCVSFFVVLVVRVYGGDWITFTHTHKKKSPLEECNDLV